MSKALVLQVTMYFILLVLLTLAYLCLHYFFGIYEIKINVVM